MLADAARGLALFRVPDGAWLGELRAIDGGKAILFMAGNGSIEILGEAAGIHDFARCRLGVQSFPLDLCEVRLTQPGSFARALGVEPP
jgi:hypothetical protein